MSVEGIAEQLGAKFSDFELIGVGGSGRVYRAREVALGRSVAVKVLRSSVFGEATDCASEAEAQARVSWHANVLTIHGRGVTSDGWPYLVLEDAEGGSLAERLTTEGPLSSSEVLCMVEQLAEALTAAHEIGVIHCDVKPSNVLFAKDGSVRLADFGTALSSTTQTLDFVEGSLVFAPPELLEGRRPGPSNDVYGLAVTALFAVSGDLPYGGSAQPAVTLMARIHSEELHFTELGLPDAMVDLLDRCAAKDPRARPEVAEVLAILSGMRSLSPIGDNSARTTSAKHEELRRTLEKSIADRREVIESGVETLNSDDSAVELVRRLLHDIPVRSALALKPLVDIATRDCPEMQGEVLTVEQLQSLVVGDVSSLLAGNPMITSDGTLPTEDPTGPSDLRRLARVMSVAMAWAVTECPEVDSDLGPIRRERGWAILGRLSDPDFLDEFFADPSSVDVFEPHVLAVMLSSARGFFEFLLTDRWVWFFSGLSRRPDIRRMVAFEHPHFILNALAADRSLVAYFDDTSWSMELQLGLSRLTTSERAGLRSQYADELAAVGVAL